MNVFIWLGVVVVALVLEAVTLELVSLWFGLGALVAMILVWCGAGITAQILTFAGVSLFSLSVLRKFVKKALTSKETVKTNIDAMSGSVLTLLKSITPEEKGEVKYNGIVWNAVTENEEPLDTGTKVIVVKISGNTIVVKRKED